MRFVLFMLVVVLPAGCGRKSGQPVGGVVKLYGQPAGNLLIQLTPMDKGDSKVVGATAISDASGRFQLKRDDGKPGMPAGKYRVIVLDNNLGSDEKPVPGERPKSFNRVPPMFSAATSPAEITIEDGKTEYEINIPPQ